MKAAFFALCAVLGLLWLLARFVPALLMSVSAFWVVVGFVVFGFVVYRSVKG